MSERGLVWGTVQLRAAFGGGCTCEAEVGKLLFSVCPHCGGWLAVLIFQRWKHACA